MSSRFPPSSGYSSRGDRSPPQRYSDRRTSLPPGPRDDPNLTPLGREPPRGPKALIDGPPRGHYGGARGRGYLPRNDFRDRDRDRDRERDRDRDRDRDFRDGPPFRRDDRDRDWPRRDRIERDFDPRDNRPPFRRSRSPQQRDPRDFRDGDIVRMRRNSRDSLVSSSSNPGDGPSGNQNIGHPPPMRGGLGRGRGRGDWEGGRGRGRGHFMEDRNNFRRRSRSRDGWWDRERERDRDFRDRDRDRDRDLDRDFDRRDRFDRRDDDRRPERDDRDRPLEPWKKDAVLPRPDTRLPSGPGLANPSMPPMGSVSSSARHDSNNQDQVNVESGRRLSSLSALPPARDPRRDAERPEPSVSRTEPIRESIAPKSSPPPSAPQVPAFGSVTFPPNLLSVDKPPSQPISQTATQGAPSTSKPERSRTENISPAVSKDPLKEAPSEPKALRDHSRSQVSPTIAQNVSPDTPHLDLPSRPSKQISGTHPVPPDQRGHESLHPTAPTNALKQDSTTTAIGDYRNHEESFSVSPPLGPAATSPSMSRSQVPPSGPGGSPQTSPRMPLTSVPTGPRAGVRHPSRGGHSKNKQWVRPGYNPQPPASNSLGTQQDTRDENDQPFANVFDKKILSETKSQDEPKLSDKIDRKSSESSSDGKYEPVDALPPVESLPTVSQDVKTGETEASSTLQEEATTSILPDLTRSSDEEDETEVFTEDYLQERKSLFEKSMHALQADMPAPVLEDPVIVDLLMKVQLLGMIIDGSVPEEPEPSVVETHLDEVSQRIEAPPTSEKDMDVDESKAAATTSAPTATKATAIASYQPTPVGTVSKDAITLDSLPFLVSGPPTPISELDVYQENVKTHERIQDAIRKTLAKQRKDASEKNKRLRDEYASLYKPWRLSVRELEQQKKEEERKASTPVAGTPPVAPSPAPAPEGREGRRYKGNSELDFQNALKASAISAQEEFERRRRMEATARPDLDKEAVVPDMLEKYEIEAGIYKDTNNKIDPADALVVFGFYPPPDDFTEEEHKKFTDAFMAYPKKWGKIAEELPGRTYAQCISHYYMTKEEIKYKAKLNKRWRSQRRARKSTTRPKSNALMSDLKPDGDDEETVQMTETGRPRRAAAPTFGGDSTTEAENSRRNGAKENEQSEKPSRRGRGGASTRGRRGRGGAAAAAAAAAQQSHQPHQQYQSQQHQPQPLALQPAQIQQQQQQQQQQTHPQTVPAPLHVQAQAPTLVNIAQPHSSTGIAPGVPLIAKQEPRIIESPYEAIVKPKEPEREAEELPPKTKSSRGRGKESIYVFDASADFESSKPSFEIGYGAMQPTSYWSVPEVRDFPLLLAHFGRDFEGISNFMKTKTPIMVKNYYQRKIDSGNNEFEEIVKSAEVKKMRGEPTGPLPVPNPAIKRRYEATPSSVSNRLLAPHTDYERGEDGRKKSVAANSPPQGAQEPGPERSLSRYPPLAQAATGERSGTTASTMLDDSSRNMHQSGAPPAPRSITGPRLGYFTEDRREARPTTTTRVSELQLSPRAGPTAQNHEIGQLEPLSQGIRTRPDYHGPSTQYQPIQYMQGQQTVVQPSSAIVSSHSRNASLTGVTAPGSPAQHLQKHTPDMSPIRRSSFNQPQSQPGYYSYAMGNVLPKTAVSPVKELPALVPAPEPPRQVPAKRSNIMSILNDEPEELPPRKRFASEMTQSPRMAYGQPEPAGPGPSPATMSALRHEEKPSSYFGAGQQQQSQASSHGPPQPPSASTRPTYSDYPMYAPSALGNTTAATASGPPINDWMAKFDPRIPTQQSTDPVRPAPQGPYSAGGSYQSSHSASNSQPPTPSQGNSSTGALRGFSGYTNPHAQGAPTPPLLTSGSRDTRDSRDPRDPRDPPPASIPNYRRQDAGSPPPHQNVVYGSRQIHSPAPSPATPLSMSQSRQPHRSGSSYGSSTHAQTSSPHGLTPQHRPSQSGHQSYQQHVQAMVNGQQGQAPPPSGRPSMGISGGLSSASSPYMGPAGSQQQQPSSGSLRGGSLSNPPPPPPPQPGLTIPRPYSPPAGSHPSTPVSQIGGIPYPKNGPGNAPAGMHIHHNPYPPHHHDSHGPPHPSHHRVYSQGGSAPSSR